MEEMNRMLEELKEEGVEVELQELKSEELVEALGQSCSGAGGGNCGGNCGGGGGGSGCKRA